MKILSFGEILWDVYTEEKFIGGAPFNFAAHMAKHGEEVYMLSALGCDSLGEEAEKALEKLGVSSEYVAKSENKQTGKCLVTLDEKSVPSYNLLQDVAYDYIPCDNIDDDFDVLYFGTLALRGEYNYRSLQKLLKTNRFGEIFVDVNIRPPFCSADRVRFCVQNATVLKISLEELVAVSEMLETPNAANYKDFAKKLACENKNLKCIIITLGSDGAYALDCKTQKEYSCGCSDVKVASTVGAGDSFSAAFLHKYLRKCDMQLCIEYATKVAGFVVSRVEAIPDYSAEELM